MFQDLCVGFEVKTEFRKYVLNLLDEKSSHISGPDMILLLDIAKLMLEQAFFLNVGGACIDFIQVDSVDYAKKLISREATKTAVAHMDCRVANILPVAMHSKEKYHMIINLLKAVSKYHREPDLYQWCDVAVDYDMDERDIMWQKSSHILNKTPQFLLDYFNSHLAILSQYHSSSIIFIRIFSLLPFNTIIQLALSFFICNGVIRRKNKMTSLIGNSSYVHDISENFQASRYSSYMLTEKFRLELEQFLCKSKNSFCIKGFSSSFT